MKCKQILCLFALIVLIPLGSANADESKTEPVKSNQLVPLIMPVASSDIGVGLAGIGIYTWNGPGHAPYRSQFVVAAARTTLGLEALSLSVDTPNVAGTKFRLKLLGGLLRTSDSKWYGYGNEANAEYIRDVEKGKIPGPGNFQNTPDIWSGKEISLNERYFIDSENSLNPGRRYLEESQNRFYRYAQNNRTGRFSLERRIGQSPFKLTGGGGIHNRRSHRFLSR